MEKKSVTLRFDLSIPRQKKAYEILINEKTEKGIPHSLVVHEALELYALKHQGGLSLTVDAGINNGPESSGKRKAKKTPAPKEPAAVSEPVPAEHEDMLTDDELDDPELLEQLSALYSDEQ